MRGSQYRQRMYAGQRGRSAALKPGQGRCDVCAKGVTKRTDGRLRAHKDQRGNECPGGA